MAAFRTRLFSSEHRRRRVPISPSLPVLATALGVDMATGVARAFFTRLMGDALSRSAIACWASGKPGARGVCEGASGLRQGEKASFRPPLSPELRRGQHTTHPRWPPGSRRPEPARAQPVHDPRSDSSPPPRGLLASCPGWMDPTRGHCHQRVDRLQAEARRPRRHGDEARPVRAERVRTWRKGEASSQTTPPPTPTHREEVPKDGQAQAAVARLLVLGKFLQPDQHRVKVGLWKAPEDGGDRLWRASTTHRSARSATTPHSRKNGARKPPRTTQQRRARIPFHPTLAM